MPTADSTGDGVATAGSDYTAASGTLTFTQTANGGQTVEVETTDDILSEDVTRTFTFAISSPSGGVRDGHSGYHRIGHYHHQCQRPPLAIHLRTGRKIETQVDIQLSVDSGKRERGRRVH